MTSSAGMTTYAYDAANRLVSVSPVLVTNTYDGDGARVGKTVSGVKTGFLYDGLEVVGEFDSGGTLTASYVHGPNLDEVLATRTPAANQTLYSLTDHLGSPVALTDSAGAIQASFTYSAFGATRTKTGTADSRFRFTGRENDSEIGLYHYRARAYDPAVGRFLQPDPWPGTPADPRVMGISYLGRLSAVHHPLPGAVPGFLPVGLPVAIPAVQMSFLSIPLGLNAYPYVLNNPLRFTDPLGLEGRPQNLPDDYLEDFSIEDESGDTMFFARGGGRKPGQVRGGGKQKKGRWHGQPRGGRPGGPTSPPPGQPKPGGGPGVPPPGGEGKGHPWPPSVGR